MKIVIINHTFQQERFYKRWKALAEMHHDLDVTLLTPRKWMDGKRRTLTYGKEIERYGKEIDGENFHIKLIEMIEHKIGTWTSDEMIRIITEIQPDIIYHIGEHRQDSLLQILKNRKKYYPKAKVIAFSMRGHQQSLQLKISNNFLKQGKHCVGYLWNYSRLQYFNRNCDAVFCHYPEAMSEFRREGYKKPIFMQTQVGVDTDVFYANAESRQRIRNMYNIGDAYLFGSASRFADGKGLTEIIQALPKEGNWKYLMIGSGRADEVKKVQQQIQNRGLSNKIILTGFIEDWGDMAAYWNAIDCAVHVPLTTAEWEETFSLSLVQAMATRLPVIGSSSGSVPYQIGDNGIIVEEKDIQALHDKFVYMINNPDYGRQIGEIMMRRAVNCFSIKHLNDIFYDTIVDINHGIYDWRKIDMTKYRECEYIG